jgi:hypothetical protein
LNIGRDQETNQEIFVRDAIGSGMCIGNPDAPLGEVSFDTVERRVRIAQQQQPKVARQFGMSDADAQKLKKILQRMEGKGQIEHSAPRWKVK